MNTMASSCEEKRRSPSRGDRLPSRFLLLKTRVESRTVPLSRRGGSCPGGRLICDPPVSSCEPRARHRTGAHTMLRPNATKMATGSFGFGVAEKNGGGKKKRDKKSRLDPNSITHTRYSICDRSCRQGEMGAAGKACDWKPDAGTVLMFPQQTWSVWRKNIQTQERLP